MSDQSFSPARFFTAQESAHYVAQIPLPFFVRRAVSFAEPIEIIDLVSDSDSDSDSLLSLSSSVPQDSSTDYAMPDIYCAESPELLTWQGCDRFEDSIFGSDGSDSNATVLYTGDDDDGSSLYEGPDFICRPPSPTPPFTGPASEGDDSEDDSEEEEFQINVRVRGRRRRFLPSSSSSASPCTASTASRDSSPERVTARFNTRGDLLSFGEESSGDEDSADDSEEECYLQQVEMHDLDGDESYVPSQSQVSSDSIDSMDVLLGSDTEDSEMQFNKTHIH